MSHLNHWECNQCLQLYGFIRIFLETGLGKWTMDTDQIIIEIDNQVYGKEIGYLWERANFQCCRFISI